MIIGSISENKASEKRVSITPEISKKYISNGFKVKIEKGIADHIGIKDEEEGDPQHVWKAHERWGKRNWAGDRYKKRKKKDKKRTTAIRR